MTDDVFHKTILPYDQIYKIKTYQPLADLPQNFSTHNH